MSTICAELHQAIRKLPRHNFPYTAESIPKNGIYFLFEKGEVAHDGERIVRVGTHTGNNQLLSRLNQHFVTENKDRSIFRKNIGRALLHKNNDPYLNQWEIDRTTRSARQEHGPADMRKQLGVEKEISTYLQSNMSFAVIEVKEKDARLILESRVISTLSHCKECQPSATWLGLQSPKEKISQSGLWLVNELYKKGLTQQELSQLILNFCS